MDFEDDLRKLEPLIGREKALKIWRAWQMEDSEGRRDIEAIVQVHLERKLGLTPLSNEQGLSPPQNADSAGDYQLGTVVSGERSMGSFGLREDEFIQHMAIFGRSGAGKTNAVVLLIKELVRHKKPFLIFDWKMNFRDLRGDEHRVPLEVYTVGRAVRPLHFNPLIPPPGTDIKIWLKKLIEIISHAYYLGEGVIFMLQEALDHVYEKFGCYDQPEIKKYPCMTDVLALLQEMPVKGRKAMWMDSTLRAVQSLCFGQISDVINVTRNDSILDLLNKNVSLELNALANAEKVFFIETLMVWIHHFRLLEGERETFKHCLIIEEAHNILSVSKQETVVDTLLREIRELGEAIVLVDQHPSQISIPALGNTYCTIALNMKHSKDIAALAEIMQVDRDHRDIFGQLLMGRAIVKLQARYTKPFQIKIPKVALNKGSITDAHLMQQSPTDYSGSTKESERTVSVSLSEAIPSGRKEEEEPIPPPLTELEELLLRDIHDHPLDGVVRRYSRLGISRRRGNHAKDGLLEKGIIRIVDIPTKTGKVVLLEFTAELKSSLHKLGLATPKYREGGLIHLYWKNELKRVFEQHGWTTEIEKPLGGGQAVDVWAQKENSTVAIEVETDDRGAENIEKLLQYPWTWILTFGINDGVKSKTQRDHQRRNIHTNHILFATPADYENKIAFLTQSNTSP